MDTPQRGQIVTIRLENFMSYDSIELNPGSHLNLIIGPNGTGKSSLVCAIYIGLGGKLKALGRAEQPSAYIKNGCDECFIEIEIYEPNDKNVVIGRKIYANNHFEFFLNGVPVTIHQIHQVRHEYKIFLDNLCTFLPQERVQDFSKLNPQQLLEQTQRTIGIDSMISDFYDLKRLQLSIKEKEGQINSLVERMDNLRSKNERLKTRVNAYLENKALLEKSDLINKKIAWLRYRRETRKMTAVQCKVRIARKILIRQRSRLRKIDKSIVKKHNESESFRNTHINLKTKWLNKKSLLLAELADFRKLQHSLENCDIIMEKKIAEQDSKEKEMRQYEETLDKLKNDLSTFDSKNGNDDYLRAEERRVNADIEIKSEEESKIMSQKLELEEEVEKLRIKIRHLSVEYRVLEKQRNFRLQYVKRYEPDVYASIQWLKENRNLFTGRIFNPMFLELDLTDLKFAKYVEARISYRDLMSFTCTNPDDLNLLIQKLRTEKDLAVNAVCSDSDNVTRYQPRTPMRILRTLGFHTYMKDIIIGPNYILHYLCKIYKVHDIPIGGEEIKLSCGRVPYHIRVFFAEDQMFTSLVSRYSGNRTVTVKELDVPKLFSVPLDNQKIKGILEREKVFLIEVHERETKLKLAAHFLKSLDDGLCENRRRKKLLIVHQREREQIMAKIMRAENNIAAIRITMKDKNEIYEEMNQNRAEFRKKINQSILRIKDLFVGLDKLTNSKDKYLLKHRITRMQANFVRKRRGNYAIDVATAERELRLKQALRDSLQEKVASMETRAKRLTGGFAPGDPGFNEYEKKFETLKNTIEELETEIEDIQIMADFIGEVDSGIFDEYERRETEIASLQARLNETIEIYEDEKRDYNTARDRWLPVAHELVNKINEKFSGFFQKMGCVGEVSVVNTPNKDNIEEFGISIKVKFRDEVPLETLGRHFQSGGERAVTTAVYLLAMQELINVPFRIVDEINQGMDAINERRILELMMHVTSKNNSPQYFFITPKILPDIECPENTVTHCIFSGENTITSEEWDLDEFLSKI